MTRRVVLLVILPGLLAAQVAREANSGYRTQEGRAGVARMLDGPDRDSRQDPGRLLASLKLRPGMVVADLGTGVGYLLPHLSRAVGPGGKVIAEDIFPDFLEKARAKAEQEKLGNVEFVLGTETDPKLPSNAVDVALVLDAYHHFDYPEKMLAQIRRALKPGGRLVVVDFYKRENAMEPRGRALQHIRLDLDDVVREISGNGFRLVEQGEHLAGKQYRATFEKRESM